MLFSFVSVKRFNGFNVKTAPNFANCLPMHFFPRNGPVLIIHGTPKGMTGSLRIFLSLKLHYEAEILYPKPT